MVDFLGIGVQKGGTTWLFDRLSRHPQVAFPGGKELHFWGSVDPGRAADWIRVLEPAVRVTPSGAPIRSGEITPAYATLPVATIEAIRAACPDVRLFVSLRNPLERAWSAAVMALIRSQLHAHEASDQWFIDHFRSSASRQRGDYEGMLDRWWSVFPRDRLLVLFQDDIAASPAHVLAALARHLDIDPSGFDLERSACLREQVVPRLAAEKAYLGQQGMPPRPSLVPVLRELYEGPIMRLGPLLGRDLRHWIDGFPRPAETAAIPRREVLLGGRGFLALQPVSPTERPAGS